MVNAIVTKDSSVTEIIRAWDVANLAFDTEMTTLGEAFSAGSRIEVRQLESASNQIKVVHEQFESAYKATIEKAEQADAFQCIGVRSYHTFFGRVTIVADVVLSCIGVVANSILLRNLDSLTPTKVLATSGITAFVTICTKLREVAEERNRTILEESTPLERILPEGSRVRQVRDMKNILDAVIQLYKEAQKGYTEQDIIDHFDQLQRIYPDILSHKGRASQTRALKDRLDILSLGPEQRASFGSPRERFRSLIRVVQTELRKQKRERQHTEGMETILTQRGHRIETSAITLSPRAQASQYTYPSQVISATRPEMLLQSAGKRPSSSEPEYRISPQPSQSVPSIKPVSADQGHFPVTSQSLVLPTLTRRVHTRQSSLGALSLQVSLATAPQTPKYSQAPPLGPPHLSPAQSISLTSSKATSDSVEIPENTIVPFLVSEERAYIDTSFWGGSKYNLSRLKELLEKFNVLRDTMGLAVRGLGEKSWKGMDFSGSILALTKLRVELLGMLATVNDILSQRGVILAGKNERAKAVARGSIHLVAELSTSVLFLFEGLGDYEDSTSSTLVKTGFGIFIAARVFSFINALISKNALEEQEIRRELERLSGQWKLLEVLDGSIKLYNHLQTIVVMASEISSPRSRRREVILPIQVPRPILSWLDQDQFLQHQDEFLQQGVFRIGDSPVLSKRTDLNQVKLHLGTEEKRRDMKQLAILPLPNASKQKLITLDTTSAEATPILGRELSASSKGVLDQSEPLQASQDSRGFDVAQLPPQDSKKRLAPQFIQTPIMSASTGELTRLDQTPPDSTRAFLRATLDNSELRSSKPSLLGVPQRRKSFSIESQDNVPAFRSTVAALTAVKSGSSATRNAAQLENLSPFASIETAMESSKSSSSGTRDPVGKSGSSGTRDAPKLHKSSSGDSKGSKEHMGHKSVAVLIAPKSGSSDTRDAPKLHKSSSGDSKGSKEHMGHKSVSFDTTPDKDSPPEARVNSGSPELKRFLPPKSISSDDRPVTPDKFGVVPSRSTSSDSRMSTRSRAASTGSQRGYPLSLSISQEKQGPKYHIPISSLVIDVESDTEEGSSRKSSKGINVPSDPMTSQFSQDLGMNSEPRISQFPSDWGMRTETSRPLPKTRGEFSSYGFVGGDSPFEPSLPEEFFPTDSPRDFQDESTRSKSSSDFGMNSEPIMSQFPQDRGMRTETSRPLPANPRGFSAHGLMGNDVLLELSPPKNLLPKNTGRDFLVRSSADLELGNPDSI